VPTPFPPTCPSAPCHGCGKVEVAPGRENSHVEAHATGRFGLSQSLALTTSFLYQRDSTPAPEVAPDDWSMTVGLSIATTW
jgi:hypothetical protein